jgi:hypothetical protein
LLAADFWPLALTWICGSAGDGLAEMEATMPWKAR